MDDSQFNGRVFFEKQYPQYDLYSGGIDDNNCIDKSISSLQELTPLSQRYFSKSNLDTIQNRIIQEIKINPEGGYDISRQSDLQVQIIMRSTFLSYSKNSYNNIEEQILVLNNKVINYAVKNIIPEIKQYLKYVKDISKPRHIISHPVHVSSRTQLSGFSTNIP